MASLLQRLEKKEGRPANFFGANASEIPNLGSLSVEATTNLEKDGKRIALDFDVADISRPLASVSKITDKGNWVCFGPDDSSYIFNVKGGGMDPVRRGGKLYFLELWAPIPTSLAQGNPFVRQVKSA